MRFKNKKFIDHAKAHQCQVQLPCCNHNTETTVAAHINMLGHGAMGAKTHDIHIAYCCSSCHDEIDARTRLYNREYVRKEALEGVLRTQNLMIKEGIWKP